MRPFSILRRMAFFNDRVSEVKLEKCCRYGQNGQPLSKEKVEEMIETVGDFIKGWKVIEDHKKLEKYFYASDYYEGVEFMKQIAKIDYLHCKNTPSMSVTKGNLIRVELTSLSLKGLSSVDFQLAIHINRLNLKEFNIEEVTDPQNYRTEVRMRKQAAESEEIQRRLAEDFGGK